MPRSAAATATRFLLTRRADGRRIAGRPPTLVVNATGAWLDEIDAAAGRAAPAEPLVVRHQGLAPHPRLSGAAARARRPHDLLRERRRPRLHRLPLSRPGAGRLDRHPRRAARRGALRARGARLHPDVALRVFPGIPVGPSRSSSATAASARCRAATRASPAASRATISSRRMRRHAAAALHGRRQVDDLPRLRRADGRQVLAHLGCRASVGTEIAAIGGGVGFPPTRPGATRWRRASPPSSACPGPRRPRRRPLRHRAGRVLALLSRRRRTRRSPDTGYTAAEIRYLVRHEHAPHARRHAAAPHLAGDHRRALLRDRSPSRRRSSPTSSAGRRSRPPTSERAFRALLADYHGLPRTSSPNATATDRSLACA